MLGKGGQTPAAEFNVSQMPGIVPEAELTGLRAVVATTSKLASGFQHSRDDLEALAEGMRARILQDPFLNQNHLESIRPLARILSVTVDRFVRDGVLVNDKWALYVEFEPLESASPSEIERFLENGGFSVAFFGRGLVHHPKDSDEIHVTFGLSPAMLPDPLDVEAQLNELRAIAPRTHIEIRHYHEHALEAPTTLVFVAGWVVGKVADKLFDKVWPLFESVVVRAWRTTVARVKLSFQSPQSTVHAVLPAGGTSEQYRATLKAVIEEVRVLEDGAVRERVSIEVTQEWQLRTHREKLPEG